MTRIADAAVWAAILGGVAAAYVIGWPALIAVAHLGITHLRHVNRRRAR